MNIEMFNIILDGFMAGTILLLTLLILFNPQQVNVKANYWFGAFIACFFFIVLDEILCRSNLQIANPLLAMLLKLPNFMVGPIFYLAVRYFIQPNKKWKKKDYLHFTLVYIIIALTVFGYLFGAKMDEAHTEDNAVLTLIFDIVFSIQLVPYFVISYRKIIKHQKSVQLFSSTVENVDLNWLKYIVYGVSLIIAFWILDIIFQITPTNALYDTISSFIYLVCILFIAYHAMKQKEIYPFNPQTQNEIIDLVSETENTVENKKKLLADDKLEEAKTELTNLMDSKKPYLDCELSLVKLADMMHTSTHLLSYVINTGFDENFYQFVNRYRIEESKKLLLDPEMNHLNLVGIGFEVGFNSKTVFNTTFKKMTNLTPTEFKKNSSYLMSAS